MADVLRIKRRSSGGSGPPASLAYAELAYNEVNDILYYGKGNNAGQAVSIIPIAGPGYVVPATPGGSTTQVQFNDGGVFAGDSGLTYDKTTDTLTAGDTVVAAFKGMSAPTELRLQSTAGAWGSSILRIKNETGVNGAMFETVPNPGAELVDFVFKVGSITQQNIRLEARTASLISGNSWEFQIGSAANAQLVVGNSIAKVQLLTIKSDGTFTTSIGGQITFQYDPNTNNGTIILGAKPPHGQLLKFCARSDITGSARFFGAASYSFDARISVPSDPTSPLELATKQYADTKVPEAPIDGQLYVRRGQDASWQVAASGDGGGLETPSFTIPAEGATVGIQMNDSTGILPNMEVMITDNVRFMNGKVISITGGGGGFSGDYSALQGATMPAPQQVSDAREFGHWFYVTIDGATLRGFKYYRPATASGGTQTVNIRNTAGTILNTYGVPSGSPGSWQTVILPTPMALTKDTYYLISIYGIVAWGPDFWTQGYTSGPLVMPSDAVAQAAGRVGQGCYSAANGPSNPGATYASMCVYLDPIVFVSSAASVNIQNNGMGGAVSGTMAIGELIQSGHPTGGGSSTISVGDTAPSSPIDNSLWWETDSGILWLRYNDGNSTSWVAVGGPSGPSTGAFLPLSGGVLSGGLAIQPASGWSGLTLASTAGNRNAIYGYRGSSARWEMDLGSDAAESGSNAGTNFIISRFNDSGVYVDSPLTINRATGSTVMGGITINPAGAINISSSTTAYADQVMINAISVASSDCFIRTSGARIWGFGVKGTSTPGDFIIVDYTAFATRITIRVSGQIEFSNPMTAPNFGFISNGGILSIGSGQTAVWDSINGSKAGSVSVMDTGGGAGSGGAIEFGANGGAWKFACIKAGATNGSGNGIGELQFWVRVNTGDVGLTRKGAMASDGVWYNTNASWSAISDRSMKENITPYKNGLAAIKGLEPVNFNYIEESPFADRNATKHIGLVAQDAAEFIPEFIGEYELNPMSEESHKVATMTPGLLVFTLINAVKEMAAEIESLKQQIGAM